MQRKVGKERKRKEKIIKGTARYGTAQRIPCSSKATYSDRENNWKHALTTHRKQMQKSEPDKRMHHVIKAPRGRKRTIKKPIMPGYFGKRVDGPGCLNKFTLSPTPLVL